MDIEQLDTFCPTSKEHWREWLNENHLDKQYVWMICYKQRANVPTISWSDAVDEALCFGWIDSTRKTIDEESFVQFLTKRKSGSVWSKINKEKVQRLGEQGLIMPAGHKSIEVAKANGSWSLLDDVEELAIPKDLEKGFKLKKGSKDFFLSLSRSSRKAILQWLVLAKRPETRQKRITEIAELAVQKLKPKQFR